MKRTILLVEDNFHIMKINTDMLAQAGYRVLTAESIAQARISLEKDTPDMIVLDIMLPDGDGLALCQDIRGSNSIPILFLSAKRKRTEIVEGLRAGGDDYLTKPYDLDELLARVEALLRRTTLADQQAALRIGSLEINPVSRRVLLNGNDLLLTSKEFTVLETLARRQNEFISAQELYEVVWGLDSITDTRTVKEHVYRLRRKLEGTPVYIESARGGGYRLVSDIHDSKR